VIGVINQVAVHQKGTFSLLDLMNKMKDSTNFQRAGAITLFIGVARGETLKREKVQKLTIEAYEEKANEVLTQICNDLRQKPDIVDVQIHHLLGDFNVGEDLVYVSVAGGHRENVFPILREAVERYKKEAPIFKKEQIVDKEGKVTDYWVEEKEN
jgi:molybdopterin synthase catalytic subunit